MDLPSLRHFENRGIFFISSDPVIARAGDQWLPAIYTDKGWATADGASLLSDVAEWRPNGQEEGDSSREESAQGDERVQARDAANRQARPRQRAKGQKPEAGNRDRTE